ncbi:MAG: hypothetical protein R3B45_00900 [Bdellovibrionota bacterium]
MANNISIDPHEILAYFQLAKANLVISRSDAAWEAANKCITLQGKSMECLLLLAMIAIESRDSEKISIMEPFGTASLLLSRKPSTYC